MYHGSSEFNRPRWERVNSLNSSNTGIDSATGTVSYDAMVKGRHGYEIPVRIYEGAVNKPRLPVFCFFHGGGFVIGSPEMTNFHVLCNKFAALGFVVVSVNYRLAPEFPFPAAVEDCYDVVAWVADPISSLPQCADRSRVVVGGDSAGGNLTFVVSSLVRDKLDADLKPTNASINICRQVLIYPALFHELDLIDTDEQGMFISKPVTTFFMKAYIPEGKDIVELSKTDRRLAPMIAGLKGLPPTTLVSAGMDVLRHENRVTVAMLREAGVPVSHHHFDNVPHGFATFHFMEESSRVFDLVAKDLATV